MYSNGPVNFTNGLVACFDATSNKCFQSGNATLRNLANPFNNAVITNMQHRDSGVGSFFNTSGHNITMVMNQGIQIPIGRGFTYLIAFQPQTNTGSSWNYFFQQASGAHNYEFGRFGFSTAGFQFKDNVNSGPTSLSFANDNNWHISAFGASTTGTSYYWDTPSKTKIYSAGTGWLNGPPLNVTHFFRQSAGGGSAYFCNWNYLAVYGRELSNEEINIAYNMLRTRFNI